MTKRERNLLLIMAAVVVIIGGYMLYDRFPGLNAPSVETTKASLDDVRKLVEDIGKKREKTAPAKTELYILDAAARPWNDSGFYSGALQFGPKTKDSGLPTYTGYIELGSEKLAILDGVEYMAGDLLEGGKYRVVNIEPDHVMLADERGGGGVTLSYEDPGGMDR